QRCRIVLVSDKPATVVSITERVTDVAAGEPPLQPPSFHEYQVFDELQRRPTGRKPAGTVLAHGKLLDLRRDAVPEVVEIFQQQLRTAVPDVCGLGKRQPHGDSLHHSGLPHAAGLQLRHPDDPRSTYAVNFGSTSRPNVSSHSCW